MDDKGNVINICKKPSYATAQQAAKYAARKKLGDYKWPVECACGRFHLEDIPRGGNEVLGSNVWLGVFNQAMIDATRGYFNSDCPALKSSNINMTDLNVWEARQWFKAKGKDYYTVLMLAGLDEDYAHGLYIKNIIKLIKWYVNPTRYDSKTDTYRPASKRYKEFAAYHLNDPKGDLAILSNMFGDTIKQIAEGAAA